MNNVIISGILNEPPTQKLIKEMTVAEGSLLVPPAQPDGVSSPIKIVGWNDRAGELFNLCKVNSILIIEGKLNIKVFEREDGVKVKTPEITIAKIIQVPDLVSINVVAMVGRAGRDPDIKYFESGASLAEFSLAVNRMRRDDPPDWIDLKIWGKTAQVAADYVKKGKQIGLIGQLQFDHWNDRKSGEHRTKCYVNVNSLELMGSKEEAQQPAPAFTPLAVAPVYQPPATKQTQVNLNDIPF